MRRLEEVFWGYLFIFPTIALIVVFSIGPAIASLYYSFTDFDLILSPLYIGWENYKRAFADPTFLTANLNTLFYTLGVPLGMVLALVLAVLLNDRTLKFASVYRAIYFVPVILPLVAVGMVWVWLFNTDYGPINQILVSLGLSKIPWLTSYEWSKISVLITGVWQGFGGSVVIILGGLQSIPHEVYEAGKLDGANGRQILWYITIPLLVPTLTLVSIISIIASFQIFDLVTILTGGGPGRSSLSVVQYIYQQAFNSFDMGYASALSVILFVVLFLLSILQFKISERLRY